MPRRHLTPLFALLLALVLPAAAGADVRWIDAPAPTDGAPLSGKRALRQAEAVTDGRGVRRGFELSPLLKQVAVAAPNMSDRNQARARKLLMRPTRNTGGSPGEPAYEAGTTERSYCTVHFCIHWVGTSEDAPSPADANLNGRPDFVDQTASIFERVYQVENEDLDWRTPVSDGTRGCISPQPAAECADKTDVYLKEIGDENLYGFAAPDPGQFGHRQYAYLVVDNNYEDEAFSSYSNKLDPLKVTAAHEYNHVVQYAYDVAANTWMFEASATWMEDVVFTAVNDYLQYIPGWAQLTLLPLTNEDGATDEFLSKTYGNIVWNRWLEATFGAAVVRDAWAHLDDSRPRRSFGPGGYDKSLAARGSSFYRAFTQFAADTAEWRSANSPFAEGQTFADVDRVLSEQGGLLTISVNGRSVGARRMPHTAYALVNVRRTARARIKLIGTAKRGARMAVALIGRTGSRTGGAMKVALKRLPRGGIGTITIPNPGQYNRLTLALINGDARTTGRRFSNGDWEFRRPASVAARLSSDFKPPRITRRSPGNRRRGVSRNARVKVRFSERMLNVRSATAVLRTGGGRKVKAKVTLKRGRSLTIKPRERLGPRRRYVVTISRAIRDRGANPLPKSSRSWTFRTRRR